MKKIIISFIAFLYSMLNIYAQDIIVKNSGETIKAFNVEISDKFVFYTLTKESEEINKLAKTNILAIRKENGEKFTFNQETSKPVDLDCCDLSLPTIDEYKGFLLAKGNAVYIPDSDIQYEQEGVKTLRRLISEQGYWKVAPSKEQAHFVIKYAVDLKGHDHLYKYPLQRRDEFTQKELKGRDMTAMALHYIRIHAGEDKEENIQTAKELFKDLTDLQTKIDKNKIPGWIERLFTQN